MTYILLVLIKAYNKTKAKVPKWLKMCCAPSSFCEKTLAWAEPLSEMWAGFPLLLAVF